MFLGLCASSRPDLGVRCGACQSDRALYAEDCARPRCQQGRISEAGSSCQHALYPARPDVTLVFHSAQSYI